MSNEITIKKTPLGAWIVESRDARFGFVEESEARLAAELGAAAPFGLALCPAIHLRRREAGDRYLTKAAEDIVFKFAAVAGANQCELAILAAAARPVRMAAEKAAAAPAALAYACDAVGKDGWALLRGGEIVSTTGAWVALRGGTSCSVFGPPTGGGSGVMYWEAP